MVRGRGRGSRERSERVHGQHPGTQSGVFFPYSPAASCEYWGF